MVGKNHLELNSLISAISNNVKLRLQASLAFPSSEPGRSTEAQHYEFYPKIHNKLKSCICSYNTYIHNPSSLKSSAIKTLCRVYSPVTQDWVILAVSSYGLNTLLLKRSGRWRQLDFLYFLTIGFTGTTASPFSRVRQVEAARFREHISPSPYFNTKSVIQ